MASLSPTATFHAEIQQRLEQIGRLLALQCALGWAARGLVVGLVLGLGLVVWGWWREALGALPLALLLALPLGFAALAGGAALALTRTTPLRLAHRVDHAAGFQERSVTALELGARGQDHPLAVAQMRDALEHLRRLDQTETFPFRTPRYELGAAALTVLMAAALWFLPNPWLVQARLANPAIAVAREQAERVERLAESVPPEIPELEALRDLLSKAAQTIEARSDEPEAALSAIEDLEQQIRQMSAGDDQLAAALAAIASALAGNASTSPLASAINTGDLREIARAAQDLAQRTEEMDQSERERVAETLREAASRAMRASPAMAEQLAEAANALDGGGQQGAEGAGQAGAAGEAGHQGQAGQGGRSAREALQEMSDDTTAAAERQRAQSQLEGSRNALERALDRPQSRSASGSTSRSSSAGQRSPAPSGFGDEGEGAGQSGSGEQSEGAGQGQGESEGGDGEGGEGEGDGQSGYGTGSGGERPPLSGVSELDTITRPEQLGSGGAFSPDEMSDNPYLGAPQDGASRAGEEQVSPSFSQGATQGSDRDSIPLGLRDLVKDYFSSLDQSQSR